MLKGFTKRRTNFGRRRAGFTVAEMLVAVAVLGVLMAVSVPNVISYQKALAEAELDGKAEQVYNAAQLHLTSLKTAGRLGVLAPLEADKVTPSDYTGSEGADTIRYAVKGSDAVADYLMPSSLTSASSGIASGSYAIELSPTSGEVYAVFYWEDDATNADGTAFSGTSMAAIESFYQSVNAYRPKNSGSFLGDHRIGYFNGGAVSEVKQGDGSGGSSLEEFSLGEVQLNVDVDEELRVHIFDSEGPLSDTDFDVNHLKLSIHVQELQWGNYPNPDHQVMITLNGGASNAPSLGESHKDQYIDVNASDLDAGDGSLAYVLDSLEKDGKGIPMSIERQTGGYIERGWNIQVTVYAEYEGFTMKYGPYEKNSLFESFTPGANNEGGDVEVGCLRHLVNLQDATVFAGQGWLKSITFTPNATISYDASMGALEPIDLKELLGESGANAVNGNNCTLQGFVIGNADAPADNVGLFSQAGVTIQDLTLKDFTVHGKTNVGALAGAQVNDGLGISNCKVEGGTVTGESAVGGLVGKADSCKNYEHCSSTANVVATGASGADSVGGLVGWASNSTFTSCAVGSVSVPVSVTGRSCSSVGGFVGRLSTTGSTLSGCQAYAAVSGGDYVGGFVGRVDDGTWSVFENCQEAVTYESNGKPVFPTVSGKSYVGGFAGSLLNPNKVSGCVAQAAVSGTGDYIGGFAGYLTTSGADAVVVSCTVPGAGDAYPTYSGSGGHVDEFGTCVLGSSNQNPKSMKDCWSKAVRV